MASRGSTKKGRECCIQFALPFPGNLAVHLLPRKWLPACIPPGLLGAMGGWRVDLGGENGCELLGGEDGPVALRKIPWHF
jgi:hypothetical protein